MHSEFRVATPADEVPVFEFFQSRLGELMHSWDASKIAWYIHSKLCGIAEDTGKIVAVVMGRPVSDSYLGRSEAYHVDWHGSVLWVEVVASVEGMAHVWDEALKYLVQWSPSIDFIHYYRPKTGRYHFFPASKVRKLLS